MRPQDVSIANPKGNFWREGSGNAVGSGADKSAKFEFALLGDGCWPSVGYLQMKRFALQVSAAVVETCLLIPRTQYVETRHLHTSGRHVGRTQARAKMWWDVFDKKFDIAFSVNDACKVELYIRDPGN